MRSRTSCCRERTTKVRYCHTPTSLRTGCATWPRSVTTLFVPLLSRQPMHHDSHRRGLHSAKDLTCSVWSSTIQSSNNRQVILEFAQCSHSDDDYFPVLHAVSKASTDDPLVTNGLSMPCHYAKQFARHMCRLCSRSDTTDRTVLSLSATLVQRLAVAPDHQRRGSGTALMAVAYRWLRRHRCSQVVVNTETDNHSAHGLYAKFGFRRLPNGLSVMQRDVQAVY